MQNLDDLLKKTRRKRRHKRPKFNQGEYLKILNLLGTKQPKRIVPKFPKFRPSFRGENVAQHLAIHLSGMPKEKARELSSKYFSSSGRRGKTKTKLAETPVKETATKAVIGRPSMASTDWLTEIDKLRPPYFPSHVMRVYRNFGYNLDFNTKREMILKFGVKWQNVLAGQIIYGSRDYGPLMKYNALIYRRVHSFHGYPEPTLAYFNSRYGRTKYRRLADDVVYKNLLADRRKATTVREKNRLDRLIAKRREQLSYTKAKYEYMNYRLKKETSDLTSGEINRLFKRIRMIEKPDETSYWKNFNARIYEFWYGHMASKDIRFFDQLYSRYDGVNVGQAIGKSRAEYAYEKLIKWIMKHLDLRDLHSTNLWSLKRSIPFKIAVQKAFETTFGSEDGMKFFIKFWKDNMLNPDNTSRSGHPTLVDWHSQDKFIRTDPVEGSAFPGIEVEKQETLKNLEEFDIRFRHMAKDKRTFEREKDLVWTDYLGSKTLAEHLTDLAKNREAQKKSIRKKDDDV